MGSISEAFQADEQSRHLSLKTALDKARTTFTQRHPRSRAAFESGLSCMPGANTRTVIHAQPFPLTFSEGSSSTLITVDGYSYVDFLGEYSAGVYGHSCEPIKAAIRAVLDRGWNFGGKNEWEAELSHIIVERFQNSIEMVRFCNSGTEANLMALGAAISFTGKKKVGCARLRSKARL
jgi:glutamate-1-semialdehyde 2,1-aminomutase